MTGFLDALRDAVLNRVLESSNVNPEALAVLLEPALGAARDMQARQDGVRAWEKVSSNAVKGLEPSLPSIIDSLLIDASAAAERDPAARSVIEVVLGYPGFEAVAAYRAAHALLTAGVPLLPRLLAETARARTGIDIHPGAEIGAAFFIDHGVGTVIGETSRIGDGVTLYQGVTLGALSVPRGENQRLPRGVKRHPTLRDGVTVYASAMILGGETVVGEFSVIGARARVCRSVPPYSKIVCRESSIEEEPCPIR